MTAQSESTGNATHAELMAKIAELTGGKPSAETVETPAAEPAKPAEDVVENEETEAGQEEVVEKPLEELTPEELIARVQKLTEERDNFKRHSRTHEDEVKKLRPLLEKAEAGSKSAEQITLDRIAALEAEIATTKKEAAVLKIAKENSLPDVALPLLYASSLENLQEVSETVVALFAFAAQNSPTKPNLPANPMQGKETTGQSQSAEVRGLNALFDGI